MADRVTAPSDAPARRIGPTAKVVYVLAVTTGALMVPSWLRPWVVPSLLLAQVVLLLALRVRGRAIARSTRRLWGVFLVLIVFQTFLPAPPGDLVVRPGLGAFRFSPGINVTGLAESLLMCGQIMTVILASMVVRHSGPETDIVNGLRRLGCPRLLACSIDNTLALLGGNSGEDGDSPRGRGAGKGNQRGRRGGWQEGTGAGGIGGLWIKARGLITGNLDWIVAPILSGIEKVSQRGSEGMSPGHHDDRKFAHDVAVISGVGLVMISLRMLKVLPGIPFASGYKNVVLVPLYILAADLTHSRFGATTAGTVMGLIGFLQGEGRYGVLDILRHVVPGLVIDGLWPLVRRLPRRAWIYSLLGVVAAACRVSTEFVLAFALGVRWEVYLFPAARVISNLAAGALSGGITYGLLSAFRHLQPSAIATSKEPAPQGDEPTPAQVGADFVASESEP